ncbi:MAG: chloride channel protein [Bacteroidales bacterium]|nr:chloride channel protein [Bacteroidales bacterium]MCF8458289.1 chloride channel protein [Bacteroidales bacterium]
MILAIVIGLSVGFAAIIIKNSVHLIQSMLTNRFSINYHNYLYFVYPGIGILITVIFTNYILKQRVGHGIPSVLYAISKNSGIIKAHNMFSSVVSSALTVGFGGSVGLEGPTVATGAAIGSNFGRLFHLNHKQIILLLGCACAGAMASIFKAPIAAIVFALEVIMLDLTMASLVPLLLASASAALTSYFFLGQDVLYSVDVIGKFNINNVPYYILLALLTGLVSVYFTRMYMKVGELFAKVKTWQGKLVLGGLTLGVLIFLFPSLYGEGYADINSALRGDYSYLFNSTLYYDYKDSIWVTLALFLMIIIFKVIATSATFGAGGIGGIFAPSLFLGVNTGLFFVKIARLTGVSLNETNFALVGMAGLIAGVIHAPLTAIFLIAEITGGYQLFMPLMLVATISYATTKIFEKNSVYTIQLAKRGELMTHDKDKAILSWMKIDTMIERNFHPVHIDGTLQDLVDTVTKSTRNVFPVVDDENIFHGLVVMDDIRHIMFKPELYKTTSIENLMFMPSTFVDRHDTMEEVARKFQESGKYVLPVLDDTKYVGFVSRANVFSKYRRMLKHFSDD